MSHAPNFTLFDIRDGRHIDSTDVCSTIQARKAHHAVPNNYHRRGERYANVGDFTLQCKY
jgi:hypothetical protein